MFSGAAVFCHTPFTLPNLLSISFQRGFLTIVHYGHAPTSMEVKWGRRGTSSETPEFSDGDIKPGNSFCQLDKAGGFEFFKNRSSVMSCRSPRELHLHCDFLVCLTL